MSAGDASQRAASLHDLATTPSPFLPFNLLDAANAYLALGEDEHAVEIIESALAQLPSEDETVAVGLHAGPMRYDDGVFGLKSEFLDIASVALCKAGRLQEAIRIVAEANDFHREQAADELYACALERKVVLEPEDLAHALELAGPFRLYIREAAFHIIRDDQIGARRAVENALATQTPADDGRWLQSLLRLTIAMEDDELSRRVLTEVLRSARQTADPKALSYDLVRAVALVRKHLE